MRKIVTITEGPSVTQLTTLERVKRELGITDDANNDLLNAKIDEASSDIEAHLNRLLPRATVSERFIDEYGRAWSQCLHALVLERTPIVSVTSITVDDSVIDSSAYLVDATAGIIYSVSGSNPSTWGFTGSIVVAYVGGYIMPGEQNRDLPPVLESAAVELVSSFWLQRGRDPTVRQEDVPGVGSVGYWVGAVGEVGDLPPGVMSKINKFKRVVFA